MLKALQLWFLLAFVCINYTYAQTNASPYKTDWIRDGAIVVGGIGASVAGSILVDNKYRLTEQNVVGLTTADVNKLDRFAAGNYSSSAESLSDFPFYGSFLTPLLLLMDDDVKKNAPQVYLLYGQAMSIAGGLYSLTTGLTARKRPYVYSDDAPLELKTDKQATNSFYAGHTAATAAATFFVAKVYHDFNPGSPARPYIWAAAAAVPVTVAYLRTKAGKHFLTDNLVGYAIGMGIGILVPELHQKVESIGLSLVPVSVPTYNGALLTFKF
ncbi:phosphatase PAP2 family protein [Pontibacter sp. H249]|uniref:phosphatase PAP2 family protein n=1 Tax=Pontibacter sp. H249 TaxID=3133420 RepID=UPI0030C54861